MRAQLVVSIGLFVLLATASDGFAAKWFGSGGSSNGRSGVSFGQNVVINNQNDTDGTNGNGTSVTEPSSLYAVGTALVLLGGAGWLLRRK